MKRFELLTICLMLVFVSPSTLQASWLNKAKFNIKVIDEYGGPVGSAKVRIAFISGRHKNESLVGETDENGSFSAAGKSDGHVGVSVRKEGYYSSGSWTDFFYTKWGRWQPWPKEITVVMRPIVNPVPMYRRNTYFTIPEVGKPIGFDLEKSDWVAPYGQGVHSDFIFQIERDVRSYVDFDVHMTLTFSNPDDGIQLVKDDGGGIFNTGSQFRLPRMAPLDGYQSRLEKSQSRDNDSSNYIFRVRSEVDENGKLVRAMYGKIRGEIVPEPRRTETAKVYMHYYLNPDYTRNLEWDPKRNLSPHLTREEKVPNRLNTMP